MGADDAVDDRKAARGNDRPREAAKRDGRARDAFPAPGFFQGGTLKEGKGEHSWLAYGPGT